MQARIRAIEWESEGINVFTLVPLQGQHFPAFEAGSHIDLRLPNGLSRSYSLVNPPAERDRFVIAVQRAAESRGGSKYIQENVRAGDVLEISEPRNNFPLNEGAEHTILIAGGIGVTPMLSMIARLDELGRAWELHYAARTRSQAAFLDRLTPREAAHVIFSGEPGVARLDMAAVIAAAPPGAHIYCCGPPGMLAAFETLTARLAPGHAHVEYFTADVAVATEGDYILDLRRSGKTIKVSPGDTMLDALLTEGVDVAFACTEGVCGTCEVKVLEGIPDHRDHFLTEEQKASNRSVMVCCSGSKTARLALDL